MNSVMFYSRKYDCCLFRGRRAEQDVDASEYDGFNELKEQIGVRRARIQWTINYIFSLYNESSWKLKINRVSRES